MGAVADGDEAVGRVPAVEGDSGGVRNGGRVAIEVVGECAETVVEDNNLVAVCLAVVAAVFGYDGNGVGSWSKADQSIKAVIREHGGGRCADAHCRGLINFSAKTQGTARSRVSQLIEIVVSGSGDGQVALFGCSITRWI